MVTESIFWRIIKDNKAIYKGHFHFGDGYYSQYYINIDKIFQYPDFVELVRNSLYEMLEFHDIKYVITPNFRSGNILAHNLAEICNSDVILVNRINRNIKLTGHLDLEGNALIIDDSINSGNTLKQLLYKIEDTKVSVEGVGVFIDRYPGNVDSDFKGLVKSVFELKNEPYNLVNINDINCKLCARYNVLKEELTERSLNMSESELENLKRKIWVLEPKSIYSEDFLIDNEISPKNKIKMIVNSIENPQIIYKKISDRKKDWIKFCLVQIDYNLDTLTPPAAFGFELSDEELVETKVFEALELACERKVDIITKGVRRVTNTPTFRSGMK